MFYYIYTLLLLWMILSLHQFIMVIIIHGKRSKNKRDALSLVEALLFCAVLAQMVILFNDDQPLLGALYGFATGAMLGQVRKNRIGTKTRFNLIVILSSLFCRKRG